MTRPPRHRFRQLTNVGVAVVLLDVETVDVRAGKRGRVVFCLRESFGFAGVGGLDLNGVKNRLLEHDAECLRRGSWWVGCFGHGLFLPCF